MKWRESYRASSSCSTDPKEINKYMKRFVTDLFVFQTGKLLILWLYSILNIWVLYYAVQSMWMCMHMCVCLRYGLISETATGLQLPWREHWIRNVNWRTDSPSIISWTHSPSIISYTHTHKHTHTHTHTPMCTWETHTHTHVHVRLGQGVFPYAAQTPGLSWLDSVWYEWEGRSLDNKVPFK